ncbi:WG repeat-containing protein [Bacillus sp. JJ1566]|uniref:WG repeat-containing protein n=1 Tax=Bacillus sp. JJ1566 TaxID=3122961 RepID=UPI003000DED1
MRATPFKNGVAIVSDRFHNNSQRNNIVIDKTGNQLLNIEKLHYYLIGGEIIDYSEGFAVVKSDAISEKGYNFIDLQGKKLLSKPVEEGRSFVKGLAAVKVNSKWGFIDYSGQFVVKPKYDGVERPTDFKTAKPIALTKGYAYVKIGNKEGIIDTNGNFLVNPLYIKIEPFSDGLAAVHSGMDNMVGYIDTKGNQIIPNKFLVGKRFYKGIAPVTNYAGWNTTSNWSIINKNGEQIVRTKERMENLWAFE